MPSCSPWAIARSCASFRAQTIQKVVNTQLCLLALMTEKAGTVFSRKIGVLKGAACSGLLLLGAPAHDGRKNFQVTPEQDWKATAARSKLRLRLCLRPSTSVCVHLRQSTPVHVSLRQSTVYPGPSPSGAFAAKLYVNHFLSLESSFATTRSSCFQITITVPKMQDTSLSGKSCVNACTLHLRILNGPLSNTSKKAVRVAMDRVRRTLQHRDAKGREAPPTPKPGILSGHSHHEQSTVTHMLGQDRNARSETSYL